MKSQVFNFMDVDNDGLMSMLEFKVGLHLFKTESRLFSKHTRDDDPAETIFRDMDRDGDGFVSAEEFFEYCMEKPGRMKWTLNMAAIVDELEDKAGGGPVGVETYG